MADTFSDDDRDDLLERGFTNDQVEMLESLELDKDNLYSDICKLMDDYANTPEEVIDFINSDYEEPNQEQLNQSEELPQQGGKRKTKRAKKNRKTKRTKKSKKSRKSRKSRR